MGNSTSQNATRQSSASPAPPVSAELARRRNCRRGSTAPAIRGFGRNGSAIRRHLAALVESSGDAIIACAVDGTILTWNAAAERLYGYAAAEVLGRSVEVIGPADRPGEFRELIDLVVRGQPVEPFETIRVRRDGSRVHVSLSFSPIRDTRGRVVGASAITRDISDRAAAEAELLSWKRRYEATIQATGHVMYEWDVAAGAVTYAGPCEATFGVPAGALDGPMARLGERVHADDRDRFAAEATRVAADVSTRFHLEYRVRHAAGHYVWVRHDGRYIPHPGGASARVVGFMVDVTEQLAARAAHEFQRALLESQTECSPDGILIISPAGAVLSYNRRFLDLWGIPVPPDGYKSHPDLLAYGLERVADPDAFLARTRYLYAHPDEVACEAIALNDGRTFERYTGPVRGTDGTHYGRVWFFRDVTERARAQEQIRQAEQQFRHLVEGVPGAVYLWELGPAGRARYVSPQIERMLGYPPADWTVDPGLWLSRVHPEDRAAAVAADEDAAAGERPLRAEYRMLARDAREVWVRDTAVAVRDATGRPTHLQGILQDITDRKHAEQIERERNGLKDAVAAMDRVLGVVGHELRTPLAGLRAVAEFLLTDGARATSEYERLLGGMQEQLVAMSDTVDNLLEAARLNSGRARWNFAPFEIGASIADAVGAVAPLVDGSRVRLWHAVDPVDLVLTGDADAVRRLVLNLVSNAHRHTNDGEIRVEVEPAADAAGERWVEIVVTDTGSGIPADVARRLGEPFALNNGVVGAHAGCGSGLGLSICRGIVAAHGGTIAVASTPGHGTVVTVRLRADLDRPASADVAVNLVRAA